MDRTLQTTQATFIKKFNAEATEELRKLNPPTFSVSTNETVPLLLNMQLFLHLFLFWHILVVLLYEQIKGTLTIASIYSTPFEPVYSECNSPIPASTIIEENTVDCLKCNKNSSLSYSQCLNCIIKSNNTNLQCCIRSKFLLKQLLPNLAHMSFQDYVQRKQAKMYMLRDFKINGTFTINEDNEIQSVDSNGSPTKTRYTYNYYSYFNKKSDICSLNYAIQNSKIFTNFSLFFVAPALLETLATTKTHSNPEISAKFFSIFVQDFTAQICLSQSAVCL